jgi:hypothetical protein
MNTPPALPGLDLEPAQTGFDLSRPRVPKRQPNPYEHLINLHADRGIRATWCPKCRTPTITGTDYDYCATVISADTTPLNLAGEVLATVSGRTTYTLLKPTTTYARLTRRDGAEIRMHPANNPQRPWHKYDVLPAHECGNPIPEPLTTVSALQYLAPKRIDPNEPAPF